MLFQFRNSTMFLVILRSTNAFRILLSALGKCLFFLLKNIKWRAWVLNWQRLVTPLARYVFIFSDAQTGADPSILWNSRPPSLSTHQNPLEYLQPLWQESAAMITVTPPPADFRSPPLLGAILTRRRTSLQPVRRYNGVLFLSRKHR